MHSAQHNSRREANWVRFEAESLRLKMQRPGLKTCPLNQLFVAATRFTLISFLQEHITALTKPKQKR